MVMVKDTSPCSFSTPVSNVFLKIRIHALTVLSHLLVPAPLCTIILHQLPKSSVSSCTSLPLHFSQDNSSSIISEKDALKKKKYRKTISLNLAELPGTRAAPGFQKKQLQSPRLSMLNTQCGLSSHLLGTICLACANSDFGDYYDLLNFGRILQKQ